MAVTPDVPSLPPLPMKTTMQYNLPSIIDQATDLYIKQLRAALQAGQPLPTPHEAQLELLQYIQQLVITENGYRPKKDQIKTPEVLPPTAIAKLANAMFSIRRIPCAGADSDPNYDVLGIYQASGESEGIYLTSELEFEKLVHQYNSLYRRQDFTQFMRILAQIAPRKLPCQDKNLIAVNNGIFNFATKTLQPFDPDLVFLSKSRVAYADAPPNPVIHNPDDNTDWDVESWMADLSDDPAIVQLLWETMGAIIRPNVPWNKVVFFYSETGNNGKGTLCALMRNLAGKNTCASISLADFSKEFMLEPLMRASCIVVDENDVGTYIDKGANLKAVITGDTLQINRKYEKPIMFRFRGLMVQCLNEMPRIKDKSESLYRRFLIVPFEKCYTGQERKYIKEDYLTRPEVLQYVLWRVLNMNYYEFSNPKECQDVLKSYKNYNDPLRQFVEEMFKEFRWDCVPFAFLFELYKAWYLENFASFPKLGRTTFFKNIAQLEGEIPGWKAVTVDHRPGQGMSKPEPLILRYELKHWKNSSYQGTNPDAICTPILKKSYHGCYVRLAVQSNVIPLKPGTAAGIEPA